MGKKLHSALAPMLNKPPANVQTLHDLPSTASSPRTARLASLADLSKKLLELKSNFQPPAQLEFQPNASKDSPKLAFTAENAPVLGYDEALLKLMIALDGVESEGDTVVREARKKLVREVDAELAGLDELRRETFEASGQVPERYLEKSEVQQEQEIREQREKVERMLASAGAPPVALNRHSNPNGPSGSNKRAEPQASPRLDGPAEPPRAYQPRQQPQRDDRGTKMPRHEPSRTSQQSYASASSSRGSVPPPRTSEPHYAPPSGLPPSHRSPQARQAPAWVRPPTSGVPHRPPPPNPTPSERERAQYAKEREAMELERLAREKERQRRWR